MNRLLVRRAAELWLELADIRSEMTAEENSWFEDFIKAYHMGNFAILEKLCGGKTELFFEMKSDITYMRDINKRNAPNPNRKRKLYGGDYSEMDYIRDRSANPESLLIDLLDEFNSGSFDLTLQEFN